MNAITRHPALSILTPMALVLLLSTAGCQMWVKRGAGQADLQADQTACKAEADGGSSDNATFNSCMTGRGWYNENAGAQSSSPPGTGSASSSSATPEVASALVSMVAVGGDSTSATDIGNPGSPVTPTTPPTINSWWKLGGGADELFSTREQCGQQTGDPASGNRYSQAFIDCMKSHKWYAIR